MYHYRIFKVCTELIMLTFDKPDAVVPVILHQSNLGGADRGFYGKISRNTESTENIIARITERNPGIDALLIEHCAELLNREITEVISEGKAADVIGLGTLYVSIGGHASSSSPDTLGGFRVRFEASQNVQRAAGSRIKAGSIRMLTGAPVLNSVASLPPGAETVLRARKYVRIRGSRLKIGGPAGGIFLVPAAADGTPDPVELHWTAIPEQNISRNAPSILEFRLPDSVTSGLRLFIAVRSGITHNNIPRKVPLTGFSAGSFVIGKD